MFYKERTGRWGKWAEDLLGKSKQERKEDEQITPILHVKASRNDIVIYIPKSMHNMIKCVSGDPTPGGHISNTAPALMAQAI